MRVALITTSFPMTKDSADGIFVARLADALSPNTDLTVVTPEGPGGPPPPRPGYRVEGFRYAPRRWQRLAHVPGGIPVALRDAPWLWLLLPGFLLTLFAASVRAARRHDVLHANWAAVGAVAGLAGRLCRTPVVTTLRGADVGRLERSRTDRFLLRLALATNVRLVGVSDAIRIQVAGLIPAGANRLAVIPNGVDDELFKLATHPESDGSRALQLVTVGSLIPRKSVATIIEALARTRAAGPKLEVVGEGPERGALAALAKRRGIADRVRIVGAVAPRVLPEMLARANAFVLASRSEGRPNALLEAMAAGLPVVVPAIPGIADLVDHGRTGLLYAQGDVDELSACLQRLTRDHALRRDLGAAARAELDRRGLRWQRTAAAYLATYRAALEAA